MISLPLKTIELMDKVRGKQTQSEFIDVAIYVLIASASIHEANKKKGATTKAKEKINNA